MTTHETPSARFISLVNERVAQGAEYTEAWVYVRQNNPALYDEMSGRRPGAVGLANAREEAEKERLRAVISRTSKQIVDAANDLVARCNYTFENAYQQTKVFHRDLHAQMDLANAQVRRLCAPKAANQAAAFENDGKPGPASVQPSAAVRVDSRQLADEIKTVPSSLWDDARVRKLVDEWTIPGSSTADVAVAFAQNAGELPAAAFAKLLDVAGEIGASLFDGDAAKARAAFAQKFPQISRAAEVGVRPKVDPAMAKALGMMG